MQKTLYMQNILLYIVRLDLICVEYTREIYFLKANSTIILQNKTEIRGLD